MSRNRMRATMRITWLLLSLSFLFHSVCSNDENNSTNVMKDGTSGLTPVPATASGTTNQENKATGATPTSDGGQKSSSMPMLKATTIIATTKITAVPTLPITIQSQAPTVTNKLTAQTSSITGAPPTVVVSTTPGAATSSLPKATSPAATSGSSSSTAAATIQTLETSSPSKTSRTEPSLTPDSAVTTKISEGTVPDQQATPSTTFTPSTVAVTETSPSQTTPSNPEPTGNTGATSTTLNSEGHPAAASTTTGTMSSQTTPTRTTTATAPQPKMFLYSLNNGQEKGDEKRLAELCRRLMGNLQHGNCTLTWWEHNGTVQFDSVEINGKVKTALAAQYYEEITKTPTDNKTLIAILASCGALLIMIVILAVCASHHRKPYNENQQHLTEELHTVENGYHDNPTLEVMEVQPEMQEKKVALNGEFNDSWIVPIDNLLKEDIPDEEDTHL